MTMQHKIMCRVTVYRKNNNEISQTKIGVRNLIFGFVKNTIID